MAYGYETKGDFRRAARVVRRVEGSGFGGTTPTERRPITQGTGVPLYDGPFKVVKVSPDSSGVGDGQGMFIVERGLAIFGAYVGYYDGDQSVTVTYPNTLSGVYDVNIIAMRMSLEEASAGARSISFEVVEGTQVQSETEIWYPLAFVLSGEGAFVNISQTHQGNIGAFGRWV